MKPIRKKIIKPIGRDLKEFGNSVARNVKSTLSISLEYPPNVKEIMNKFGGEIIREIVIKRTPVSGLLTGTLNIFSLGKFGERMEKSFDELFHLFMIVTTQNGIRISMEKQERINMGLNPPSRPDEEIEQVSNIPSGLSINQLMENARKRMGNQFFRYDSAINNCQDWILNVLQASGIGDQNNYEFVKQDTAQLFVGLPTLKKVAHTATDLGAIANKTIAGGTLTETQNVKTYGSILEHLVNHIKDPSEPIDPRDFKQAIKVINTIRQLKGKGLKKSPSQVQSIIFPKSEWTIPKAKKWLKLHNYVGLTPDVKESTIRFRQQDVSNFNEFRIKHIPDGILLVLGFK